MRKRKIQLVLDKKNGTGRPERYMYYNIGFRYFLYAMFNYFTNSFFVNFF